MTREVAAMAEVLTPASEVARGSVEVLMSTESKVRLREGLAGEVAGVELGDCSMGAAPGSSTS